RRGEKRAHVLVRYAPVGKRIQAGIDHQQQVSYRQIAHQSRAARIRGGPRPEAAAHLAHSILQLHRRAAADRRAFRMAFYDIFNGDADGICALHQLRLVQPRRAALVTGVKRDIRLLRNVTPASGDELTVLDISLDANRAPLSEALRANARVCWFDHHHPGEIPHHPGFEAHIDTDPQTCTSLIVDRHLGGRHRAWAIVAAFGDNLDAVARKRAHAMGLGEAEIRILRELGVYLNYNAYGESVADLRFAPDELYTRLHPYADPLAFARESTEFETLRRALAEDLERAAAVPVEQISAGCAMVVLPEQAWSRRVIGAFANRLAQDFPSRA